MNRWLSVVVSLAIVGTVSGCNNPTCGPGTVQVQGKNNKLTCQPVDVQRGRHSLRRRRRRADRRRQMHLGDHLRPGHGAPPRGVCISTGGGGDAPPPCPTPGQRQGLRQRPHPRLLGRHRRSKSEGIHVALYDPLAFIGGAARARRAGYRARRRWLSYSRISRLRRSGSSRWWPATPTSPIRTRTGAELRRRRFGRAERRLRYLSRRHLRAEAQPPSNAWGRRHRAGPTGIRPVATSRSSTATPSPIRPICEATETHPISGVTVTEPSGTSNPPASGTVYFSSDLSTVDPECKVDQRRRRRHHSAASE